MHLQQDGIYFNQSYRRVLYLFKLSKTEVFKQTFVWSYLILKSHEVKCYIFINSEEIFNNLFIFLWHCFSGMLPLIQVPLRFRRCETKYDTGVGGSSYIIWKCADLNVHELRVDIKFLTNILTNYSHCLYFQLFAKFLQK